MKVLPFFAAQDTLNYGNPGSAQPRIAMNDASGIATDVKFWRSMKVNQKPKPTERKAILLLCWLKERDSLETQIVPKTCVVRSTIRIRTAQIYWTLALRHYVSMRLNRKNSCILYL